MFLAFLVMLLFDIMLVLVSLYILFRGDQIKEIKKNQTAKYGIVASLGIVLILSVYSTMKVVNC